MQAMASALNGATLQDNQIQNPNPNPSLHVHDDFLDQMLSSLPSTWPDLDGSNPRLRRRRGELLLTTKSTLLASRCDSTRISGERTDLPGAKTPANVPAGHQQQQADDREFYGEHRRDAAAELSPA
ncbi:uncharacterized protein A4U43_C08F18570 [Asparagus officinalis]|nr:uncharacterized protein A4U43_C08F18570 [Asparagus officinalis]